MMKKTIIGAASSHIERTATLEAQYSNILAGLSSLQKTVDDIFMSINKDIKNIDNRLNVVELQHRACPGNMINTQAFIQSVDSISNRISNIENDKKYWSKIAAGVITALLIAVIMLSVKIFSSYAVSQQQNHNYYDDRNYSNDRIYQDNNFKRESIPKRGNAT